jgi:hypothetical protein
MKATIALPCILIPLTLAFASCTKKEESVAVKQPAGDVEQAANNAVGAANQIAGTIEGVHSVECGCSDAVGVGACGNYVQVGDKYYEIEGDLGLGKMEWCHDTGNKAQVKGMVKDGKFKAESLTVVP